MKRILLALWLLVATPCGAQIVGGSGGSVGAPVGPAGGDLSGSYPNPTVASISNSNAGTAAFLTAPTTGSITGWEPLELNVIHALPITAGPNQLTCTTFGTGFPGLDVYSGTLGAVGVTEALPTTGCQNGQRLELIATQGNSAVAFTVTGSKQGSELWSIGTAAGNKITQEYQYDATANQWEVFNPGTYPAQALPVAVGGSGTTSTLTGVMRGGSPMTASELSGDATTSGSNAVTVVKINGASVSNPPKIPNVQYLSYAGGATTLTLPTGSTYCQIEGSAGGGGGNGVVVTGSAQTACQGATGASSGRAILGVQMALASNPCVSPSPCTISIGNGGNAGSNSASTPTVGQAGGNSTLAIGGKTYTWNGGGVDSTAENSACSAGAGTAGQGGTVPLAAAGNQSTAGIAIISNATGQNGLTNNTGNSALNGGNGPGGRGGNGGAVNASGAATGTPQAGDPGWFYVNCTGATTF